jgi:hypothetical protein
MKKFQFFLFLIFCPSIFAEENNLLGDLELFKEQDVIKKELTLDHVLKSVK